MENKIEAVVRENVDTALEQADEFLKQASAATGEEAKELQAKAKECLARASRNMKSFYDKTSEEGREIAGEVNDCVRSNTLAPGCRYRQLSAACPARSPGCSQVILPEAFGDKYVR